MLYKRSCNSTLFITEKIAVLIFSIVLFVILFADVFKVMWQITDSRPPLKYIRGMNQTETLVFSRPVPKIVWTFWFGQNMNQVRLRSLQSMRDSLGVEVRLITASDLPFYSIPCDPIHSAIFENPPILSGNHIVDYLRAYWMVHYGGGYQDIKPTSHSWAKYFDNFFDSDLWIIGTAMEMRSHIACHESYLERLHMEPECEAIKDNWQYMVSDAAWIARPGTPLAKEFLAVVSETLNNKLELLRQNPVPQKYAGRCCASWHGTDNGLYPLRWAQMHGEAFDPIQVRWNHHVRQGLPRWDGDKDYLGE